MTLNELEEQIVNLGGSGLHLRYSHGADGINPAWICDFPDTLESKSIDGPWSSTCSGVNVTPEEAKMNLVKQLQGIFIKFPTDDGLQSRILWIPETLIATW